MLLSDKQRVMEILHSTFEFKPIEVDVAEDLIDAYIQQGVASGYTIYIAEEDSKISGYICFGDTPLTVGTWDIYWIAVGRDSQGKGIGRALLKKVEDFILSDNAKAVIRIETSGKEQYDSTRNFYDRTGFREAGKIPDFYAEGDSLLNYYKTISR